MFFDGIYLFNLPYLRLTTYNIAYFYAQDKYVGVYLRLYLVFSLWIFDKSVKKAICKENVLIVTGFSQFGVPCMRQ